MLTCTETHRESVCTVTHMQNAKSFSSEETLTIQSRNSRLEGGLENMDLVNELLLLTSFNVAIKKIHQDFMSGNASITNLPNQVTMVINNSKLMMGKLTTEDELPKKTKKTLQNLTVFLSFREIMTKTKCVCQ